MYQEKHLVIGAGFVGLGMAKALKEKNIPYDQVDADSDIGGNWYHGVYRHVHIISSKKTTEFTDYPMPKSYPDFPSAEQMLHYLREYAEHFKLREHIELNKAVTLVTPTADEKWLVHFKEGEPRIYKGVLVCNGHHWSKREPEFVNQLSCEYIHSKEYRNEEILKDKKVLVIGGGNSGCDIAVDAARVAKESHISLRNGYWFLPKTMLGKPTVEFLKTWLPVFIQRIFLKILLRIVVGRYEDYGLQKPKHKIFERHPTINSLLLYYLKHGVITPHPDIKKVENNIVEFVDGTKETFDLVIAATGFYVDFPFLPAGLVEVKNNIPQLSQGSFHPKHKGLYIVGWIQVRYGVGPLVTAGAPSICEAIKMQDKLKWPLGAILKKLGRDIPKTHLFDPMRELKEYKKSIKKLKWLPLCEKLLFYQQSYESPEIECYKPKETNKVVFY